MENLEPKHLTPYLDHSLNLAYDGFLHELKGIIGEDVYIDYNDIGTNMDPVDIDEIKLILRPLSYYAGSKTGGELMKLLNCTLDQVSEIWDLYHEDITLDQVSYGTYKVMCKNKLDFNKLIEKGLAIDINKISHD